jgi:hypothetical protein
MALALLIHAPRGAASAIVIVDGKKMRIALNRYGRK